MSILDKNLHLCSCNGTMPLDAEALARALKLVTPPTIGTSLCQRQLSQFADGVAGDALVACTQETRLLGEVAEEGGRTQAIHFVNIRETGGWSAEAKAATPNRPIKSTQAAAGVLSVVFAFGWLIPIASFMLAPKVFSGSPRV